MGTALEGGSAQPAVVIASSWRTVTSARSTGRLDRPRLPIRNASRGSPNGPLPDRQRAVRLRRTRNTCAPSEGWMG